MECQGRESIRNLCCNIRETDPKVTMFKMSLRRFHFIISIADYLHLLILPVHNFLSKSHVEKNLVSALSLQDGYYIYFFAMLRNDVYFCIARRVQKLPIFNFASFPVPSHFVREINCLFFHRVH